MTLFQLFQNKFEQSDNDKQYLYWYSIVKVVGNSYQVKINDFGVCIYKPDACPSPILTLCYTQKWQLPRKGVL
mgnify:CR=1 FL=1